MPDSLVITALLKHYKSQGIDLYHVLDDPLFSKLPLETKIEAVKANAAHIVEGSKTSPGFNRPSLWANTAYAAGTGALTGAVLAAHSGFANGTGITPRRLLQGARIGGIAGGITGAFTSGMSVLADRRNRQAILESLSAVADSPTTENAIGALSASRTHGLGFENTRKLLDRTSDKVTSLGQAAIPQGIAVHDVLLAERESNLGQEQAAAEADLAAKQSHLDSLNK